MAVSLDEVRQIYRVSEMQPSLVLPKTETRSIRSLTKLVRQFLFDRLLKLAEPLITND